jgi:hypothetical protein
MHTLSADGDRQGPHQRDEEANKDWHFRALLLTLILPFL